MPQVDSSSDVDAELAKGLDAFTKAVGEWRAAKKAGEPADDGGRAAMLKDKLAAMKRAHGSQ
eukprot:4959288-Karenia_brevis.AAC.1